MSEHLSTGTSIICKFEYWEIKKFKNMRNFDDLSIGVFKDSEIVFLEDQKIRTLNMRK